MNIYESIIMTTLCTSTSCWIRHWGAHSSDLIISYYFVIHHTEKSLSSPSLLHVYDKKPSYWGSQLVPLKTTAGFSKHTIHIHHIYLHPSHILCRVADTLNINAAVVLALRLLPSVSCPCRGPFRSHAESTVCLLVLLLWGGLCSSDRLSVY